MLQKVKKLLNHPLLSGSAVMMGGSMFINGINYLYHLLMGKILGPVDYGSLAAIFSILYITSIVPVSTSFAIVKFISGAKNQSEQNTIYTHIRKAFFTISTVLAILLLALSPVINSFLHLNSLVSVLLLSPIVFLMLVTLINQASLQGQLKFWGVVGPNFASSIGKLLFGLLLVYIGLAVQGAVLGVLLGVFVAYFYSIKLIKGNLSVVNNRKYNLKPFFSFAGPVLIQALAFTSFFTTDLILVKHFLPPFEAGLYAALSTLGKILYFATQPITAVMFPVVSKRRTAGASYTGVVVTSLVATFGLSLAIVLFYYFFPNLAIGVLYGSDYLSASSELVWMGVFLTFYTLSYLLVNFMLSIGKTKVVIIPLVFAIIQIIGIYIYHNSLLQVIQISLFTMMALFTCVCLSLGYFQLRRLYVKN